DDDIVRRIELLAVVVVDEHGDGAVMLGARDAPRIVLAADKPAFAVARVAVAVIRRRAEDADMAVLLEPAHHAVVGNVAPQQKAAVAHIDRTLGPAEAGGDALDRAIADLVLEALVERLDPRVRVAPAR